MSSKSQYPENRSGAIDQGCVEILCLRESYRWSLRFAIWQISSWLHTIVVVALHRTSGICIPNREMSTVLVRHSPGPRFPEDADKSSLPEQYLELNGKLAMLIHASHCDMVDDGPVRYHAVRSLGVFGLLRLCGWYVPSIDCSCPESQTEDRALTINANAAIIDSP